MKYTVLSLVISSYKLVAKMHIPIKKRIYNNIRKNNIEYKKKQNNVYLVINTV